MLDIIALQAEEERLWDAHEAARGTKAENAALSAWANQLQRNWIVRAVRGQQLRELANEILDRVALLAPDYRRLRTSEALAAYNRLKTAYDQPLSDDHILWALYDLYWHIMEAHIPAAHHRDDDLISTIYHALGEISLPPIWFGQAKEWGAEEIERTCIDTFPAYLNEVTP